MVLKNMAKERSQKCFKFNLLDHLIIYFYENIKIVIVKFQNVHFTYRYAEFLVFFISYLIFATKNLITISK